MEDHGGSKKLLLSYSAQFGLRASWASGRLHARLRYGEPTYAQETSPGSVNMERLVLTCNSSFMVSPS